MKATLSSFDKKVKTILVRKGVLEEPRAEEASVLALQQEKGIADVIFERNFLDEMSFISAIAQEMNIPPIDVERVGVDDKALQSLSQDWATYYGALPVGRIGNLLTLAVSNPFDVLKLDDVRLLTGCDIRPVVSTERAIRKAIQRAYNPGEEDIAHLLEKMEQTDIELHKAAEEEDVDLAQITDDKAAESPIIKLVDSIVSSALKERASDIHIEPYERKVKVRFRKDGVLYETISPPKKMHNAVVSRIKIMCELDIAERRVPQDGKFQMKYEGRQVDFRVSILPSVHGEKVVIRILDSSALALSLDALGFETEVLDAFRRSVNASYGMILVTGPTGSGKSTTLYSALKEVLCPEDNIVTVEDPVEYQLEGVIQVPVNNKRGLTFAAALRSILRQDPDTIMIGEIRDFETADIAVKAALTGHLVLSTLHTNDAPSTITRLVDMGIDPFLVSSSVLIVAAQRLARKLCEHCRQPEKYPIDRLTSLGFTKEEAETGTVYRAVGCNRCTNGYKGRFALVEAMEMDEALRRMVIEGKSALDLMHYSVEEKHMMTLRRCAVRNGLRGLTTVEEILRMTM